jgi:hypothetical protein
MTTLKPMLLFLRKLFSAGFSRKNGNIDAKYLFILLTKIRKIITSAPENVNEGEKGAKTRVQQRR